MTFPLYVIPKELAFPAAVRNVEIERIGNNLVLRPAERQRLADFPAIFASFPSDFMAGGREFHEQKHRDWSGVFATEQPQEPAPAEPPVEG